MHERVWPEIASLEGLFFSFALDQCLQHSRAGHHYFSLWRRISLLAIRGQFGLFFAMHDPGRLTSATLPKNLAQTAAIVHRLQAAMTLPKTNRVNSRPKFPSQ
jgi:hypothetical protein